MKLSKTLSIRIKNFVLHGAQALVRSMQSGLTTVQFIEIKSKIESAEFVSENLNGALLFSSRQAIQLYAAEQSIDRPGIVLEMGVYDGGSINLIAQKILEADPSRKIYGLDSFRGLEESWTSTDHYRSFDVGGIPPQSIDKRVTLIQGRVEKVLEPFLLTEKPTFSLVHFDMDLYAPSYYALKHLLPFLKPGTLILFDELYGYPGWQYGEYKALTELINRNQYRFLAFGPIQALIEVL